MRHWLAIAFLMLAAGCGEETGIPQPDPVPRVSLIKSNAAMSPTEPEPINLVALPGCVAGEGTVTVEAGAERASGPSRASGSFALTIRAHAGQELAIRYNKSAAASFRVPAVLVGGATPPRPIPGVPPVTPAGAGRVLVRGQADALGRLLGVSPAQGDVVTATAGADGRFQLELAASSGQELRIYNDDDSALLGSVWTLTAP